MILSDTSILQEIASGNIVIQPFDRESLGSNSYDVHLSKHLAVYQDWNLDAKKHTGLHHFDIPEYGYELVPGTLYLGSTLEYTESHLHLPILDGKSSIGRLGIDVHKTAGIGDVGFCGHWTLEIVVTHKVVVYPGMPIGQIIYHMVHGEVERPYNSKGSAKYNNRDPRPKESMMFKNKF